MNFLDRAIGFVSPQRGRDRMRARMEMQRAATVMAGVSGYEAAKRERAAMRNFNPRARTADEDALPGLPDLRARSRHMLMNAPIAAGAVKTVVTNVVGPGLRLSTQPDRETLRDLAKVSDAEVDAFEVAAAREWSLFCLRENADFQRRLSFARKQDVALRGTLSGGDCFVAVVAGVPGAPFDFALQLIEADRVSNPHFASDSETLAAGIEYDQAGRPVACHVAELPRTGVGPRNWRRMPFRGDDGSPRVLHLMHGERIGQSRGVPYLAPVIAALKDLDRYTEAEITAAVLNACIAILGDSKDGVSPLQAEAVAAGTANLPADGLRRAEIAFEPGMTLEGFMPGETIKSFSPDRPNQGFDPFVQAVLRQVGVALELPFEVLVKHFTASYSAARAALLQAWGFFRVKRAWLAEEMCQPVYELVLRNAAMRGRLDAPGLLQDPVLRLAWCGARWTGPSMGQIQPEMEVNAAEKRVALRISSRTRETAEISGDDWDAVQDELRWEEARIGAPLTTSAADGEPFQPDGPDDEDERIPGEAPRRAAQAAPAEAA